MVKLKEITKTSWLVIDNINNQLGILSRTPKQFTLLYKKEKKNFTSQSEVEEFFKNKGLFSSIMTNEANVKDEIQNYVKGFPVDLKEIYIVDTQDVDLPVYTKTEKSDTWHCAGYYCLKYPKGWLQSYCPKLDTLSKYEYRGPFKTKTEMKVVLSQLKRDESRKET